MKLAQLTDLHLDDFLNDSYNADVRENLDKVLKDIKARNIKDIILTGDLCLPESFPVITEMIDSYQLNSRYLMGNHDNWDRYRDLTLFQDWGKEDGYYGFEKRGEDLHIFMDSRLYEVGEKQKDWLKQILKTETYKRILLFIHHPVLDCGGTTMDRLYPLRGREELVAIFHAIQKEVFLFCGHYHGAYDIQEKMIHQFVTPSLLVQLQKHSEKIKEDTLDYAYRIIDLDHDTFENELIFFKGRS